VSLTPVGVKILERMIVNRMYYWMEKDSVINKWLAGFQRGRSTEEQVLRMVQDIQDGYEVMNGHHKSIVVTLDCSKAYDRVWRVRLIERLMDERMPGRMVRWLAGFLEGRQARVRVNGGRSGWKRMQEGLPQGAVCSPALFLLYVNDWEGMTEDNVCYSGFADDLAIWGSARRVDEVVTRIQGALDKIETWATMNKIELNPSKCEACLFTRDPAEKHKILDLKINGAVINTKREVPGCGD